MNMHVPNASDAPSPTADLDFNRLELALSNAKQMADICLCLLNKLERLPNDMGPGFGNLYSVTVGDHQRLSFAAWQAVNMASEAQKEFDRLVSMQECAA